MDPSAAGGNGAAPAAAAEPVGAGDAPAAAGDPAAAADAKGGAGAAAAADPAVAKPKSAADAAAEKITKQESPETKAAEEAQKNVAAIKEDAKDLPSATDLPNEQSVPKAAVDVGGPQPAAAARPPPPAAPGRSSRRRRRSGRRGARCAPAAAPVEPQPASSGTSAADLADQPAGGGAKHHAVDPSQFGQDGHGGTLSAEGAELLKNKNVTFDPDGIADIKAGKIDPRVIAAVTKIAEDHKIKVTCMCSDHPKFTSGGSVSNHAFGRGLDIGSVDGEIVNPGSGAARELASELSQLPEQYRPDEIGSPWPISGPGYFTDGAHQDHLHLGFKKEIDPSWSPPGDVAAKGGSPDAAAAAVTPAAPVAPAPAVAGAAPAAAPPVAAAAAVPPPEPKAGDSGQFMAAAARAVDAKKGGSGSFLAAQPPAGPPQAVASAASVPGMVDAAAAAAPGSGASSVGAAALKVAQTQLGVHEQGVNTGAEVDKYLAAAKVGPGNPWCASFVTWSLEQSGHKMNGSGWAAVQTWVQHAEAKQDNLQVVTPPTRARATSSPTTGATASDFGSDGHIGFLASNVQDGKFTALEGNNQDQVMKVPRDVNMANVKFIRVGGDAPPAAPPVTPTAPAAVDQAAGSGSGGVADAAAAAVGAGGPNPYPGDDATQGPDRGLDGARGGEARPAASSCRSWPRSSSPA